MTEWLGYIARLKKEIEERNARQTYQPDRYLRDKVARSDFCRNFTHNTAGPSPGFESNYRGSSRGGYAHRGPFRGGYAQRGRGYGPFHPYHRTPVAHSYSNRSISFNASKELSSTGGIANPIEESTETDKQGNKSKSQAEPRSLCPALTSTGISSEHIATSASLVLIKSDYSVGLCTRHGCRYIHDPNKQALCKRWLYKDDCSKGDNCSLSHKATPHNAPTCLHFQAGRCNNDPCRFAHIRVSDAAQNCEAFGHLGYCEKGDTCGELHAHECPAFANTGKCPYGSKCRWGHVHRASRMRKASRPSSAEPVPSPQSETVDQSMDMTKAGMDPVQSDGTVDPVHHFTQQMDFVPLDEAD